MAETSADTPFAVTWEAELTRPRPFLFTAFHGEAFRLVCHPRQGGQALAGLSGAAVRLRWQSAGMDAGEWYAKDGAYDPATGAVSAVWDADCDDGGDDVRFFLAIETAGGVSFRVHGALRLAPSPGFSPAAPLPESVAAELQAAIDAEQAARTQADEAEQAARTQADAEEAAARKQADEALAQADETLRAAIDAHAGRTDNPHAVTAAQVGALTEAAANGRYVRVPPDAETIVLNHLLRGLRFYAHNDAEAGPDGNSPFFVIGSQLSGGQLREDRWLAKLFYNAIEFLRAPGTERVRLEFNRPGDDKANSDAIVIWKEMVAALAEATEGLIGADGGTVGGVLRMKNPKIATDDDTAHDIALVPNGGGQGLQVQFPGGSTAMIRMKTGTLATTEEVKDGLAAKQDKLVAGENVTLTAQADGTVKIDAENNAIPKNMATGRFPNGTEKPIIDIVWDVESIYGRYAYYFSAFLDNSQVVKFLIGQDGSGSLVEREVPTKAYVDGLVGDIDAALAQI